MLKVEKEDRGGAVVLKLSGTIDDGDDLNAILGQHTGELIVNGKGVDRVNSVGVKNWIKYFSKVKAQFEELSPILVDQVNSLQNFCGGGDIVSIVVPYQCGGCQTNLRAVLG